jgi:hypothetical protein
MINSSIDCRSLCCNLKERCVSWQYISATRECKLGPIMRLGLEKTGKPGWCDPIPPQTWKGAKLLSRSADGKCEWGDSLPLQCFGFGDPRVKSSGEAFTEQECQQECCNSATCDMWQQHDDRGCFYSRTKKNKAGKEVNGITCSKKLIAYTGGRKCLKGYCGGLEDKILPVYEENKLHTQMLKSLCKSRDCAHDAT